MPPRQRPRPRHVHRRRHAAMPLGTQTIACTAATGRVLPRPAFGRRLRQHLGDLTTSWAPTIGFCPQPPDNRSCRWATRTTAKTCLYGFSDPRCPVESTDRHHASDDRNASGPGRQGDQSRLSLIDARRAQLTPAVQFPHQGHESAPGGRFRRKLEHSGSVCPGTTAHAGQNCRRRTTE